MSYLTAVLLGLVQGIAEFLPISSSGHLALLQNFFHIEEADLLFDVMLHVGTLIAIFLVYRRDIADIAGGGLGLIGIGSRRGRTNRKNVGSRRMAVFVVTASLPLLLALPLRGYVGKIYQNPALVSLMLMVNGTILYFADRYASGVGGQRDASVLKAFLVGLGQLVAIIPGISRSGTTIAVGRACGFSRSFAVKFSFLLSVPAVIGAAIVSLVGAAQAGIVAAMIPKYLCGMIASIISGYFGIRLLNWVAAKSSFGGFAYYCWGTGIVALILSMVA